jgi:hypothetical protein
LLLLINQTKHDTPTYRDGGKLPKYLNGFSPYGFNEQGQPLQWANMTPGQQQNAMVGYSNVGSAVATTAAPMITSMGTDAETGLVNPGAAAFSTGLQGAGMGAKIGTMIAPGIGTIIGAGAGALLGGIAGGNQAQEAQEAFEKKQREEKLDANLAEAKRVGEISKMRSAMITGTQMRQPDTSLYTEYYGGQVGVNPFQSYNNNIMARDGGMLPNGPAALVEDKEVIKAKNGTYKAKGETHEGPNEGIELGYDNSGNIVAGKGGTFEKISDIGNNGNVEIASDNKETLISWSKDEAAKYFNA